MLKLGPIKPSLSPLDSLVVLVKRKMGMSVSVSIFASGSIVSNSLIKNVLESVGPGKYISTLDLARGYWQVPFG